MNWNRLIDLANDILKMHKSNNPDDLNQAIIKTVVNRAYYGAYNLAVLQVSGNVTKNHSSISSWCTNSSNNKERKIGQRLSTLYGFRTDADYTDEELSISDAKQCILHAMNISTWLGQIKNP